MQIKETSEDPRLQALNKPIDLAAKTRETGQLLPVVPARPTAERGKTRVARKDRRKGERRKQQRKVLLNTRTPHDRRTTARRTEDGNSKENGESAGTNPSGIDIEC